MDVTALTLTGAARALRDGDLTAESYAAALLDRCAAHFSLNAFIAQDRDAVLSAARDADAKRKSGATLGALHGVPLAIKDNLDCAGYATTGGTPALRSNLPKRNAPVVQKLLDSGAIVLGKANMHEMAFGITNNNAAFGAARNPYDPSRIPGGSSGGTGVAVAARLAPAGIGTDTGGSVRIPAALCGIAGFRPTVGRWPQAGILPISHTRDTAGPMAHTVTDLALLDAVVTGSVPPVPSRAKALRLGVPRRVFCDPLDAEVGRMFDAFLDRLRDAGATVIEVALPATDLFRGDVAIARYEAPRDIAAYLRDHGLDVGFDALVARIASPDVRADSRKRRRRDRGGLPRSAGPSPRGTAAALCRLLPPASAVRADLSDHAVAGGQDRRGRHHAAQRQTGLDLRHFHPQHRARQCRRLARHQPADRPDTSGAAGRHRARRTDLRRRRSARGRAGARTDRRAAAGARTLMASDIPAMDAVALAAAIRARAVSCVEAMNAFLDRIERLNPQINAIVSLRPRDALIAEAKRRDAALARGDAVGPLHGFPHAVKDLEPTAGIRTTFGSPLFRDFVPDHDSLQVARLKRAGAIIIGKTNTPEFGLGSHTFNEVFGPTRNPYDRGRSAGGSSGGAGAALAARLVPLADGSDYAGSLRNPAAWNNVYALRPSPGLVPRETPDLFLASPSVTGPMARSIADLALLLSVQAGHDPRVPLSNRGEVPRFAPLDADFKGARIAWCRDFGGHIPFEPGVLELCEAALPVFANLGCAVEAAVPELSDGPAVARLAGAALMAHLDRAGGILP